MGVCVRSDQSGCSSEVVNGPKGWLLLPATGQVLSLLCRPPLSAQFLPSVSSERDEQHPRDEASVQPATKELGRQPGGGTETVRGAILGCVNSLSGMKS